MVPGPDTVWTLGWFISLSTQITFHWYNQLVSSLGIRDGRLIWSHLYWSGAILIIHWNSTVLILIQSWSLQLWRDHSLALLLMLVTIVWCCHLPASEMVRVAPLPVIPHLTQHQEPSQCQSVTSLSVKVMASKLGMFSLCRLKWRGMSKRLNVWKSHSFWNCKAERWSSRQVSFLSGRGFLLYVLFVHFFLFPIVGWTAMFFCLTVSINFVVREISISDLHFLSR